MAVSICVALISCHRKYPSEVISYQDVDTIIHKYRQSVEPVPSFEYCLFTVEDTNDSVRLKSIEDLVGVYIIHYSKKYGIVEFYYRVLNHKMKIDFGPRWILDYCYAFELDPGIESYYNKYGFETFKKEYSVYHPRNNSYVPKFSGNTNDSKFLTITHFFSLNGYMLIFENEKPVYYPLQHWKKIW